MKITIETPEFGDFVRGEFTMNLFETDGKQLFHHTGTNGEYKLRAKVDAPHVPAYVKSNIAYARAGIKVSK